jgi:ABC-type polysaccharide transport system permease subunit
MDLVLVRKFPSHIQIVFCIRSIYPIRESNHIIFSIFYDIMNTFNTPVKQIRCITLPSLVPSVITLTLLSIGRIFYSDFGLFYQVPLDSGTLYSTTNVIDTYVYRALIKLGNVGMSSAACLYQSVVGFVLVLTANLIVRKVSKENALF